MYAKYINFLGRRCSYLQGGEDPNAQKACKILLLPQARLQVTQSMACVEEFYRNSGKHDSMIIKTIKIESLQHLKQEFNPHNEHKLRRSDAPNAYLVGQGASGPLHTRDCWEPVTSTLQALSSVKKAELVQVRFTPRLRDQWNEYVNARWMWSVHGFLHGIEWITFHGHSDYFKTHLLEVGQTQNRETMALWTLTSIDVFYFIMCEDQHE